MFRYGSGAISLLSELLKLDWRKRLNAIDALQHPYFRNTPLPAKPGDLPTFEESHELDRRKFRGQKAAPPPAPKGGTVGMGPNGGGQGAWGGEPGGNGNQSYGNGDNYGGYRPHQNGSRYPSHSDHRNGGPPLPPEGRRPAWRQNDRLDTRIPPRPPPVNTDNYISYDGGRSDARDGHRSRSRDLDRERPPLPRSRAGVSNGDTYIPSYGPDTGRPSREDRPRSRDDRPRRRDDRDDRRYDRDRLDYDDRSRSVQTRSRSRSPVRDRDRDRIREREPLERDRDRGRDRDIYRR